jgi:hypothetical protein
LQPFIGFYTDKTEALFLSNRYGVHHFWIGFIIDSNSVLDDTGGSFLVGIGFDISSRSVTSLLGSGGKEVWPNPSSVRW